MPNEMVPVAVDLGYGAVKVVAGGRRHVFPARYAPHASADEWGMGREAAMALGGGEPFVAGQDADGLPGVREPLADGRLADPEALPLLAAALWASGAEGDVVLGSGLPLARFGLERDAARAALQGRTLRIRRGRQEREVRIRRVVLRPQGVGAALHLVRAGLMPRQPGGLAVVVDVGQRTLDVLTVRLPDLVPVRELSTSAQVGVGDAVREMAALLEREVGYMPPLDVAEAALHGPVRLGDRVVAQDRRKADAVRHALARRVADVVAQRLRGEAMRVVGVAFVGGGAHVVSSEAGGWPTIPVPVRDAQYANALGYLWAAETAARKGVA